MEEIAAGAGVAVGTLYRHYPTKADLLAAAVEHSLEEMADWAVAADEAIAAGGDARAELAGLLARIASRGSENRALRSAALSLGVAAQLRDDGTPPVPGSPMATLLDSLDRVLISAQHAGALRDDVSHMDITVLLRGVLDIELDSRSRLRYVEIILRGLEPVGEG
jgi:AcrR family transcriptional regulator